MDNNTFLCSYCGGEFPTGQQAVFCGETFCQPCFDLETTCCSVCHERIWRSENSGTEDTPLCSDCFEDYYVHCSRCGALLRESHAHYSPTDEDESSPYCTNCYRERGDYGVIHDYFYKPFPYFTVLAPAILAWSWRLTTAGNLIEKRAKS